MTTTARELQRLFEFVVKHKDATMDWQAMLSNEGDFAGRSFFKSFQDSGLSTHSERIPLALYRTLI